MLSKLSSMFRRPPVMSTPTNTSRAATSKASPVKREIKKEIEVSISEPAKVIPKETALSLKETIVTQKELKVLKKEPTDAKVADPIVEIPMRSAKAKHLTGTTTAEAETQIVEIPADLIASRAFEIWHQEGCLEDRHESNWMQAVAELRAKFAVQ